MREELGEGLLVLGVRHEVGEAVKLRLRLFGDHREAGDKAAHFLGEDDLGVVDFVASRLSNDIGRSWGQFDGSLCKANEWRFGGGRHGSARGAREDNQLGGLGRRYQCVG